MPMRRTPTSAPPPVRRRRRRAALATTAVAVCASLPAVVAASTPAGAVSPTTSPLTLLAPHRAVAYSYRGRVDPSLAIGLRANGEDFSLWSHRSDYVSAITTQWHHGASSTTLPAGTLTTFSKLRQFLVIDATDAAGKQVLHSYSGLCLNGQAQRVVPDGSAHSRYPFDCPWNPFTVGSVQGIAAGWATYVPAFGYTGVKLTPGRYTLHIAIAARYRHLFGISAADGARTILLRVVKGRGGGGIIRGPIPVPAAHVAGTHPMGPRLQAAPSSGPRPDLVSAPAWGIGISPDGNFLTFSATVWNAGESPLVVDGFRRGNKDVMDAYQYFYDAAGNQTGYVPAGTMVWDARRTHQHWHFQDFARYRLLGADKHALARSRKEAFCLADTDAMDYTVAGADWNPYNTDLATACGDHSSQAVSEVLSSGSGDTYQQYRAGQSFDLRSLPNGVYYVSVEANPYRVLTEVSRANNVALRKVRIGGVAGHRTVKVTPVGDITA